MKKETIENVVGLIAGDIYVDVNIRFLPQRPLDKVEERLANSKVNSELGVLAHEIKTDVQEKLRQFFNPDYHE